MFTKNIADLNEKGGDSNWKNISDALTKNIPKFEEGCIFLSKIGGNF